MLAIFGGNAACHGIWATLVDLNLGQSFPLAVVHKAILKSTGEPRDVLKHENPIHLLKPQQKQYDKSTYNMY